MSLIKKVFGYIKNPRQFVRMLMVKGTFDRLDDERFVSLLFWAKLGRKLNLKNPKDFNEKLQWLKLYDHRDEYTTMVDKQDAKAWIAERIGEEYIIPTLGVYNSFDEIDFDALPDRFVLKCTHDSGGLVVCTDKSRLNKAEAKTILEKSLNQNYYRHSREWPYKNVKPRIIAEEYMEDPETAELRDYKFFTFNGEPRFMMIVSERMLSEEAKSDFFDMDGRHMELYSGHPNAKLCPALPVKFDQMKELSRVLARDIPHLRVDFYEVAGRIYAGELTFFHWSGYEPFQPKEWNDKIGSWITLPEKKTI